MMMVRSLLIVAAFLTVSEQATSAPPRVPAGNPPYDAPGQVRNAPGQVRNVPGRVRHPPGQVRSAPAPVLGAGLPAIIAAGVAMAGYWLRRRRRGRIHDG
jgi:hypothetical protein